MRHQPRRVLTPVERGFLKHQINELETQLNSPELTGFGSRGPTWGPNPRIEQQHRDETAANLQRLKKRLEEGVVGEASKRERNRTDKRIKELEESIRKRLAPSKFYHAKQEDAKDYHKTVDHLVSVEFNAEHNREVTELKNLLRARTPDNPNAGSIEHLRS